MSSANFDFRRHFVRLALVVAPFSAVEAANGSGGARFRDEIYGAGFTGGGVQLPSRIEGGVVRGA